MLATPTHRVRLKYFKRRITKKLTTPKARKARLLYHIACINDFLNNHASGSGGDKKWAEPGTPSGDAAIMARAEELLERDIRSEQAGYSIDSIAILDEDSGSIAKTEAMPDFAGWLEHSNSVKR